VGTLRCGSRVRIALALRIPFDDPFTTAYLIVPLEGFEPSQYSRVWIPGQENSEPGGYLEIPRGYDLIEFELVSEE
jgi:hypothetical protein